MLAAKVNGAEWDISRPIAEDAKIELFKWDDPEGKHAFWHSSAHLLAEALQELYPGVKFGIGPAIENGFYYDIDPGEHKITSEDFPKIEKKMMELVGKRKRYAVPTFPNPTRSRCSATVAKTTSANS